MPAPDYTRDELRALNRAKYQDNPPRRITPQDEREFNEALISGTHNRADDGAPGPGQPGTPATLAEFITLDQAKALATAPAPGGVRPGVLYAITGAAPGSTWNLRGEQETVYVEGLDRKFGGLGQLGAQVVKADVGAGTYEPFVSGATYTGTRGIIVDEAAKTIAFDYQPLVFTPIEKGARVNPATGALMRGNANKDYYLFEAFPEPGVIYDLRSGTGDLENAAYFNSGNYLGRFYNYPAAVPVGEYSVVPAVPAGANSNTIRLLASSKTPADGQYVFATQFYNDGPLAGRVTMLEQSGTGGATPFGPLTATGAANETFALPAGTKSVRGVQVFDANPGAGQYPVLGLVASMYTLNTNATPPTLSVLAPYTLSQNDTIEGIALVVASAGGGGTPQPGKRIATFIGDSITGADATGNNTDGYTGGTGAGYFVQTKNRLGNPVGIDFVNEGFGGKGPQWFIDNRLAAVKAKDYSAYASPIVFLVGFVGGNGLSDQFSPNDATTEYNAVVALCQQLQAIRPGEVQILLLPYLNRVDSHATNDFDAKRTSVNQQLAANYQSFASSFAPLVEQRTIYSTGSPTNATYCFDGVHLTGSGGTLTTGGAGILAELTAKYIAPLLRLPTLSGPAYRQDIDYTASLPQAAFGGFFQMQPSIEGAITTVTVGSFEDTASTTQGYAGAGRIRFIIQTASFGLVGFTHTRTTHTHEEMEVRFYINRDNGQLILFQGSNPGILAGQYAAGDALDFDRTADNKAQAYWKNIAIGSPFALSNAGIYFGSCAMNEGKVSAFYVSGSLSASGF